MQQAVSKSSAPYCGHDGGFIPTDNGLGELFREYGEEYIKKYRPSEVEIKLIRSIRVCRTPALGGKVYECKSCGDKKYIYFSCGNSRCPKCQGIKRLEWQQKIGQLLLKTPYVHMVFTMPHQLNGLARRNPYAMYNCLMRSAWSSLKACCAEENNLGATPGAVMVLHTFGSDLKYHNHVHALVSFGGLDTQGAWKWPKRKRKLVPFRQIRSVFRSHFLTRLKRIYPTIESRCSYRELCSDLLAKSWCVHAEPPTANTKVLEEYLGRYICRIGLSKNRFHYDPLKNEVTIQYKDYRNKNKGSTEVPKAIKILPPLIAINQIIQHCLPAYFQKCRYYGIHASSCKEKCKKSIPKKVKENGQSVRTLFQILTIMLGLEGVCCKNCGGLDFHSSIIASDRSWIQTWLIHIPNNKGSPKNLKHPLLRKNVTNCTSQTGRPMAKIR